MRGKFNDLTGRRFGKLVAVSFTRKENDYHSWWICKCDCGNTVTIVGKHLVTGDTKSCGCITKEILRTIKPGRTHGQYQTRLYKIWTGMKQRCFNPKQTGYELYGGRGISICAEWLSFENFQQWAMTHGYTDELTIDRINSDGNYEPSNCAWISKSENSSKAGKIKRKGRGL